MDVAQRDPGVQRRGDERVPRRVGLDGFGDPGAAGGLADDPPGAVAVRGASGIVTTLPPLRVIVSAPVATFEPEVFDVGAGGLRYP